MDEFGLGAIHQKLEAAKRERLLDILRRVIANPTNATRVAAEIAAEWDPTFRVRSDGSVEIMRKTEEFFECPNSPFPNASPSPAA